MTNNLDFIPQTEFSIHTETRIGVVTLTVSNLKAQIDFYNQVLGIQVRRQEGNRVFLGNSTRDLLVLIENPTAERFRRVTGLYHLALLYPDRRELARAVARVFAHQVPNYPTDHIMTKTTYLDDQEGNGLELYCESPEDGSWSLQSGSYITRRADGSLSSGREPLDLEALFKHLEADDRLDGELPPAVSIGHVHLHVRDLSEALDFYHGVLGFDMMGMDATIGMAFVSAGGYHHHIGLNTWQGIGAPAPPPDTLGLKHFSVELPEQSSLDLVLDRIRNAGMHFEETDAGWLIFDPSKNGVLLTCRI
jgi:catechol 2,3-dioxygenase